MIEINKIYQDDCLKLMPLIDNKSIDMILCDMPYGITACKWDTIIPLNKLWEQYKRIIKDNGAIVLTASQPFTSKLIMSNLDWFKYEWIWEKNKATNIFQSNYAPMKQHENILVFSFGKPKFNPQFVERSESGKQRVKYNHNPSNTGKREYLNGYRSNEIRKYNPAFKNPYSIIYFNNEVGLHPTQKPVTLFEYLIKTYTNKNDLVLDNCIGSGTTAVACKLLDRNFIGIEINQEYADIANKRINDFKQQLVLV